MPRAASTLALVATVGALALPAAPAGAACVSGYPASDKRLTNHMCDGVRPGMLLNVPSKKYGEKDCTAGFLFADQFGNRYTSVPGTCHLDFECLEDQAVELLPPPLDEIVDGVVPCINPSDSEEEPVYRTRGPVVRDRAGDRVGVIVYAVNKSNVDFALIRIDGARKVDPSVPLYGGPTRLAAPRETGEEAYAYSAAVMDFEANARTGVLVKSGDAVYHEAIALIASGIPEGSPVVQPDGTGIGYHEGPWSVGLGYRTLPYGPALSRSAIRTKLQLRLLTAKPAA